MKKLDDSLRDEARRLADRGYTTDLDYERLSDGTIAFLASHPELPGCMAHGDSMENAEKNLGGATEDYILSLLEDGVDVPYPRASATQTGASAVVIVESSVVAPPYGADPDKDLVVVAAPTSRRRLHSVTKVA